MRQAKKFLSEGNKVKLTVKFTGRQITRKDFGEKILRQACQEVVEYATQESPPKMQGKLLWVIFSPIKKIKKHEEEK